MKVPAEALEGLINSRDYREFLKRAFAGTSGQNRTGYADFARRAGFASRSYPRDVLLGLKRISASSLPKFIRGLGLKGDLQTLFTLLVIAEEPDANHDKLNPQEIRKRTERIRKRLLQGDIPEKSERARALYQNHELLYAYAALGTTEHGASLAAISKKTGMPRISCRRLLDHLCKVGVARKSSDGDHYFPLDLHLVFTGIGKEQFFKNSFVGSLSELTRAAQSHFDSDDQLFFQSVFSVSRSRLPQLKQELRDLLVSFADSRQEPEGDVIINLTTGLIPR